MTRVLLTLALCLSAVMSTTPVRASAQATGAGLRPGDRISVTLRDTAIAVTVRNDGRVLLPVVGPLAVAGLDPIAAEDSVLRAFAAFVRGPEVRAVALRRVVVQGAVRRPDVFYVDATIGLAEVLGMAGGVSEDGHRGKVDLFRAGQRIGRYDGRTPSTLAVPLQSGDMILVAERSWWARNPSVLLSLISSAVTVIVVLQR